MEHRATTPLVRGNTPPSRVRTQIMKQVATIAGSYTRCDSEIVHLSRILDRSRRVKAVFLPERSSMHHQADMHCTIAELLAPRVAAV